MSIDFQLEPDDFNFDRQTGRVDLIVEPPMMALVGITFTERDYPDVTVTFVRPWLAWWDRIVYAVKLCIVR